MLFGYSLSLRRHTNVNKTQHESGHYSGVLWVPVERSVKILRYVGLVVVRRYLP